MSKRITIDGLDITDHVAAMYDALVGSMDWGSGFLDDEQIEALLLVGEAAGWEMGSPSSCMLESCGFGEEFPREFAPSAPPSSGRMDAAQLNEYRSSPEFVEYARLYRQWSTDHVEPWAARRLEHWRAQMRAKIAARIAELKGET